MPYAYTKSLFTEEHEIFRDSYRRFLATEADAHVDEWLEQGAVPKSFWKKAGEQGFLAVGVPEEYGGPGAVRRRPRPRRPAGAPPRVGPQRARLRRAVV